MLLCQLILRHLGCQLRAGRTLGTASAGLCQLTLCQLRLCQLRLCQLNDLLGLDLDAVLVDVGSEAVQKDLRHEKYLGRYGVWGLGFRVGVGFSDLGLKFRVQG